MGLMEYFKLFTDTWRLMKKHSFEKLSDEWCEMVIREANAIAENYENDIFACRLLGLVVDELERIVRKNEEVK